MDREVSFLIADPPQGDYQDQNFSWRDMRDQLITENEEFGYIFGEQHFLKSFAKLVNECRVHSKMSRDALAAKAQVSVDVVERVEAIASSYLTDERKEQSTLDDVSIGVIAKLLAATGYRISSVSVEKPLG